MMNIYEESTLNFWIWKTENDIPTLEWPPQSPDLNIIENVFLFCNDFLDMSLILRSCKNDHIIFNVGTPSLEARNIRLINIITCIIEESKLISENMSPNVIHC
jgi:hypothetical protein